MRSETSLFLAFVCLSLAASEVDINDFDVTLQGYEFIFHDTKDLGLLIHGNNCYFLSLPDTREDIMTTDYDIRQMQANLIQQIEQDPNHQHVQPSSLDTVRNKYQDRLADFHCAHHNIFEMDTNVCSTGWLKHDGSCYKFFSQHESYSSAKAHCHQLSSHLVEITSWEENSYVHSLLGNHAFQDDRLWIGLTDTHQEGTFVLPSSGLQPGFSHWQFGQPDNHHGQDCAVMRPLGGVWDDTFCNEHHTYVCEK